ncbi:putative transcription factor with zinc cluster DNA-binding motif [Colletotrichum scovillei]|uniref:Transcription factor with zinc cluster DNA-binding motif n=1 Tax=Colletotrichum scovillei TaxID=1209932 RepID=A0A9P7RG31_9PEZI|nr:putative transcription factor with zinc cluster DNA-binding motif [Colletotrichum scovillei]KAG7076093.1 putative transcription factor with zinc cluster DNA-binding motif [Colletotrichum scovillei]KAG7083260.1 putative transcription factor with zinc cluster DNA-binding motif [Colletotrichum scovillei]
MTNKRKKTGCLGCRSRKKKCDENHPDCHFCVAKQIECVWPDNWQEVKTAPGHNGGCSYQSCDRTMLEILTSLLCIAVASNTSRRRQHKIQLRDLSTADSGIVCERVAHVPTGMVDEIVPESVTQHILSVTAADDIASESISDGASLAYTMNVSPTIQHIPFILDSTLRSDTDDFQLLFQHFVLQSMPSMAPDDIDLDLFLKYTMPLVLADDLVMRAALALSSAKYMMRDPTSKALYLSRLCHSQVTNAIRIRIITCKAGLDERPVFLCAATILMAVLELTLGSTQSHHIDFATHLILNVLPSSVCQIDRTLYRFLLRACIYIRAETWGCEGPAGLPSDVEKQVANMFQLAGKLEDLDNEGGIRSQIGLLQTAFVTGLLDQSLATTFQEGAITEPHRLSTLADSLRFGSASTATEWTGIISQPIGSSTARRHRRLFVNNPRLAGGICLAGYVIPLAAAAFRVARGLRIASGLTSTVSGVTVIPLRTAEGFPVWSWILTYGVWATAFSVYLWQQTRRIPRNANHRRQLYLFCVIMAAGHFTTAMSQASGAPPLPDIFTLYGPIILTFCAYSFFLVYEAVLHEVPKGGEPLDREASPTPDGDSAATVPFGAQPDQTALGIGVAAMAGVPSESTTLLHSHRFIK